MAKAFPPQSMINTKLSIFPHVESNLNEHAKFNI